MARASPSAIEGRRGHLGIPPSFPEGRSPTLLATVEAEQRFRPQQHISDTRGRCHAGKRDLLRWRIGGSVGGDASLRRNSA